MEMKQLKLETVNNYFIWERGFYSVPFGLAGCWMFYSCWHLLSMEDMFITSPFLACHICVEISPFWHAYVLWLGGLLVKTWRQSDTRRDVRALHDVTSDMSHERHDFFTWLLHANAHPASRISQYDNSHPVRCFWILLEFRNTIVRLRSRVIRDMIIEL